MRWPPLCFIIFLTALQSSYSQQLKLEFVLADKETGEPVSFAHVFISDSSIGTTSDATGNCELKVAPQETQTIIISHISYETLTLGSEYFPALRNGITIPMTSTGIDLDQIQVTADRGGKWKQNVQKFEAALLGEGKPASKCKILNPEVLRFEEEGGKFTVKANELLHIDNEYLGYDIRFRLEELSIDADGSKFYKGNGQFIPKENANSKHEKRREAYYQNSLSHFLTSLIQSPDHETLENFGYQVSLEEYDKGIFSTQAIPELQDLIHYDGTTDLYQLHFPDFLAVRHLDLFQRAAGTKVSISGAEQQKFGSDRSQTVGGKKEYTISRLYKIKPFLLIDIRGNIINKDAVKEYNYWAGQRLATTLPVDYKDFSDFKHPEAATATLDTLSHFKNLMGSDENKIKASLEILEETWTAAYVAPLLDMLRLSQSEWLQNKIKSLLELKAPEIGSDYFLAVQSLWKEPAANAKFYFDFKAELYSLLDPAFHQYFYDRNHQAHIRLDEILWGGVKQDGIPPLRSPEMLPATQASYLSDTDVIFGIVINGRAFAYPQRILAWHEFFTAEIEGLSIAGVYCTLCGTVIIYDTAYEGVQHELGTSGFLYRSNKLMYDKATQSLWSTILGQPVVGPLVNQGIELKTLPVVTSSWGEWRKAHPTTQVLSLETGESRNYDEGEAYKKYYANDELMFPVPTSDKRLVNKARVFVPRTETYKENPLALSVEYLRRKGLHQDRIGQQNIIVLTESGGESRAYAIGDQKFKSYELGVLKDSAGNKWEISEEELTGTDGQRLVRIPAHEVFWFAWINAFPETRLIH